MKNLIVNLRTGIFKNAKSTARYFNLPTTYPSSFNKPMNPWDNLDPGRKDNTMVDEYDKIGRKFQPGDQPPSAWRGRKEFPEYYKPYLLNYQGHGYLLFVFGYYYQKEYVKKIKGREVLKDYSHEKKIIYSPFINLRLLKELKENEEPIFKYLKRYIRESGF